MVLDLGNVLSIIARNMEMKGNPLGVDRSICHSWASKIGIARGGGTVIYTSCMYQSVPYIVRLAESMERIEGRMGGIVLKIGKIVSELTDLGSIARVSKSELERFNNIVLNIAEMLKRIGIDFGYLYEDEPYSGSLLYELGLEDMFVSQANHVVDTFRSYGVKRVIAIDPHTYFVLSRIYPKYIDGFDIEVIHYLELIHRNLDKVKSIGDRKGLEDTYTIHDPCLLARFTGVVKPQREILKALDIEFREPERSGVRTRCCGGPLESISPTLSKEVGRIRASELRRYSKKIIAMCPICISNLYRSGRDLDLEIYDISEVISRTR